VTGGTEEQYMNLLTDELTPYLRSSGISYSRNTPQMTAASSIRASNAGNYDLHFALHSNAAPEGRYGEVRGIDVYFYPGSGAGEKAARIIAENLRDIYPLPQLVRALPNSRLGELRQTKAPSVFLELGYHDNREDAQWITSNLPAVARNLALSLTEYFGLPLVMPMEEQAGVVATQGGNVNLRSKPSAAAPILTSIPNGTPVTILGRYRDWATVAYRGLVGFIYGIYVRTL
jgi:N-acetylmuramoyl-L-alanine amidase